MRKNRQNRAIMEAGRNRECMVREAGSSDPLAPPPSHEAIIYKREAGNSDPPVLPPPPVYNVHVVLTFEPRDGILI